MKSFYLTILLILMSLQSFAQYGYYNDSTFMTLSPIETDKYFAIADEANVEKACLELDIKGIEPLVQKVGEGRFILDSELQTSLQSKFESEIYISGDGYLTIILPEIILTLDQEEDLDKILNKFKGILAFSEKRKNATVLNCNYTNSSEVLYLVGQIQDIDFVECCHPGMLSEIKLSTNYSNPLFGSQFYLHNTTEYGGYQQYAINATKAWELVSGSPNVTVAVLDSGVERYHEDLFGAVIDGLTIGYSQGLGDPINFNDTVDQKAHGTLCAGIIGAIDNNIGIKGVASGSKIMPINIVPEHSYYNNKGKLIYGFCEPKLIADAIYWAEFYGADILSCSWSCSENRYVKDAFNYVMTSGRNGLGCIVVASSGNDYENGKVNASFPASIDDVLCVGAITQYGSICSFSQRGDKMDLVAPGISITSTDRMGTLGYVATNYTSKSGTSVACPQVAGVAALMLSANPYLSRNRVTEILHNSATDMGTPGFDTTFGYGLVNAYKAVALSCVESVYISGPSTICPSTTASYTVSNLPSSFDVQWCLQDGCGPIAPPIQISNNTCSIYNNLVKSYSGTLTAEIRHNGNLIKSIYKPITAYAGFYGIYGSNIEFSPTSPAWADLGANITLKSPNFIDKNITFNNTMTLPSSSNYDSTNGILNLRFPNGYTTTPIMINVQPNSNSTNCDNNYQLLVMPTCVLPHHSISICNIGDDIYCITLQQSNDFETESLIDNSGGNFTSFKTNKMKNWHVEIINALTGDLIQSLDITGDKHVFNTNSWKSSTYIIRVVVGEEILTEKIII